MTITLLLKNKKAPAKFIAGAFLCLPAMLLNGCSRDEVNLNNPQAVYDNYCFACHDTGAAGAPRMDQAAFWQSAADQRERLYNSTIKGVRAMPKKGTCLSCSDEQLKQVVDWMLEQSARP